MVEELESRMEGWPLASWW